MRSSSLDAIIQFKALDFDVVLQIVDKFILELEAQLALKDVEISVSLPAREWLAEQGFDPEMGARPMKRVIQNQIKRPLADDLLFGDLADGGEVDISLAKKDGKKLNIRIFAPNQSRNPKKPCRQRLTKIKACYFEGITSYGR